MNTLEFPFVVIKGCVCYELPTKIPGAFKVAGTWYKRFTGESQYLKDMNTALLLTIEEEEM